jgi:hypothetical protein
MASPIAAKNSFNIEAHRDPVSIDFSAPFAPTTQTYHGFSIQVAGVRIGRITSWTPQQKTRTITHVFELNPTTFGQPVDAVPGIEGNFTVSFARAEVWGEEIEKAFGADDVFTFLINQNKPFTIDEVYAKPGVGIYRVYRYLGCWFSSLAPEAFTSEGNAIISVSGDITFVNKVKVVG